MEKHKLTAEKRKVTGRKVKALRKQGILPANIYGKDIKSLAVQIPVKDFLRVYEQAGVTGIIELSVGDGESHPVLVHNLQLHPVGGHPLHVDFHRVSLTEKVKATVPVVTIGESPAISQKLGVLLTPVGELEVEALPADLPEKIEVETKELAAVGQEIKVKDLKISDKITVFADPELVVAKIGELLTEEAKKMLKEEKAAAEAAAAEAAAEKGEAAPAEEAAPAPEAAPSAEEGKPSEAKPSEPAGKLAPEKPVEKKK